ncbi:hypothetical protein [Ornithinimicrobium sp. Y1694]|uniref:hypothetical protein n=1 Tax=Ornithinimicrobium sp. Y1694 TaxID=3418590 RepID=UPI003CFA5A92
MMSVFLVVVAGCSEDSAREEADVPETAGETAAATTNSAVNEASARVDEDGFEVTLGRVTASAPAGVAPVGTVLTLREVTTPEEVLNADLELAAPVFDISFEDGLQPERPVTITLALEDWSADDVLAFSTLNSETDAWDGIPVDLSEHQAQVTLDHFSLGVFTHPGDMLVDIVAAIAEFGGMRFPEPECARSSVEVGERRYSAGVDSDDVYPCAEEWGDTVALSLHSNSPFVWRVKPDGNSTAREPESPGGLASLATTAAFSAMVGDDHSEETIVVPGGSARVTLQAGAIGTEAELEMSAVLGGIAMAMGAIDPLVGELPKGKVIEFGRCVGQMWSATADADFVPIMQSIGTCAGVVLGAGPAFIISVVVSVAPTVASLAASTISVVMGTDTAVAQLESELLNEPWTLENALLPAGSCDGWAGADHAVQLVQGKGEARYPNGDYAGITVMSVELLGTGDVIGDGSQLMVVSLLCTGHEIEWCCVGRTGQMTSVAVLRLSSNDTLEVVLPGFSGGHSLPGNEHGPAKRAILSASFDGSTLTTTEYLPYPEHYTWAQVGHDPTSQVTTTYTVQGGRWEEPPRPQAAQDGVVDVSHYDLVEFTSATGAITCRMDRDRVQCQFPAGPDPAGAPQDGVFCGDHWVVGVGMGQAAGWVCAGGALAQPTLGKASTAWFNGTGWTAAKVDGVAVAAVPHRGILQMGAINCSGAPEGFMCVRSDTGTGFMLTPGGVERYPPMTDYFYWD